VPSPLLDRAAPAGGGMKCEHCTEAAVVFVPGTDEIRELFLLVRGVAERRWCLSCARQAGWPWIRSAREAAA